jgi:hypothetical protein
MARGLCKGVKVKDFEMGSTGGDPISPMSSQGSYKRELEVYSQRSRGQRGAGPPAKDCTQLPEAG